MQPVYYQQRERRIMRFFYGGSTQEFGKWAATIQPTTQREATQLGRHAATAAGRLANLTISSDTYQ